MSQRLLIHELAEQELNEAAQFYEFESRGLGLVFLTEAEHTVNQIQKFPKSGSLVRRQVRRKLIRGFPFSVFYSVKPESIRILAFANQNRQPHYWRGRRTR